MKKNFNILEKGVDFTIFGAHNGFAGSIRGRQFTVKNRKQIEMNMNVKSIEAKNPNNGNEKFDRSDIRENDDANPSAFGERNRTVRVGDVEAEQLFNIPTRDECVAMKKKADEIIGRMFKGGLPYINLEKHEPKAKVKRVKSGFKKISVLSALEQLIEKRSTQEIETLDDSVVDAADQFIPSNVVEAGDEFADYPEMA